MSPKENSRENSKMMKVTEHEPLKIEKNLKKVSEKPHISFKRTNFRKKSFLQLKSASLEDVIEKAIDDENSPYSDDINLASNLIPSDELEDLNKKSIK